MQNSKWFEQIFVPDNKATNPKLPVVCAASSLPKVRAESSHIMNLGSYSSCKSIVTSSFKTLNFEPLMPENTLPPLTRAPIQAISMQFTLQAPFAPIHTQTYTTSITITVYTISVVY